MADAMLVSPDHLVTLHQTHSCDVHTITQPFAAGSIKGDALVTAAPGIALGVLSGDCAPVLFADAQAGVIAAAHAGWKGALFGVLEATLDAMEAIGAKRAAISVVIGPTISQNAYEVGPEFRATIRSEDPGYSRFFAKGSGDRYHFDLPAFGLHRLHAAGVGSAMWTGHCTYGDADLFYSYRRSVYGQEADYGRLISAVRL